MATQQELDFNFNEDQMRLKIRALEQTLEKIYLGGGKARIEKHHESGKLTARERIAALLDPQTASFEVGALAGYEMYAEHGGCPGGGVVVVVGYVSGRQCIVVAIDAKQIGEDWIVYSAGGTIPTKMELFKWAKEVALRGAGEILFTSMSHDGTKKGFANDALRRLSQEVNIPIIASGGAGVSQHFIDVFIEGKADAALAASVFHFNEIPLISLKETLKMNHIKVR